MLRLQNRTGKQWTFQNKTLKGEKKDKVICYSLVNQSKTMTELQKITEVGASRDPNAGS